MKTIITSIAVLFFALTTLNLFATGGEDHESDMGCGMGEEIIETGTQTIGAVTLAEAEICAGIEDHAPVDVSNSFSKDTEKIWVYTKFTMDKEVSSKIQHVYYLNGQKISTVELDVKGPSFRTNSYKTITEKMAGDWKVEILAEDGSLFETLTFTITE